MTAVDYDLAVVGAGVLGLSCALAAARAGHRVIVVDRDAQANGASIRNFGFVTVTGQERGAMWRRALRSRDLWLEIAREAAIPVLQRGLLLAARRKEALAVLEAFLDTEMGEDCRLLSARTAAREHPELRTRPALAAALTSPHELRVESRTALPQLSAWLESEFSVAFRWRTAALRVEPRRLSTTAGEIRAERIAICPGDDLFSLFPDRIAAAGISRCKLQMLRLADPGRRYASPVMSDLSLARYAGYAALPAAAALRARLQTEQPLELSSGVHLIVVQSGDGTLVVGDSHHYAATPHPFTEEAIDALILQEYAAVFEAPPPPVLERWSGTYAYAPDRTTFVDAPAPGVRLVMVTTGAGASTGFALGEEVVSELFEEEDPW